MHAPTAVGLAIILIPYILLNLKGDFRHSLGITLAAAIPFLAVFPWIFDMLLPTTKSLFSPTPLPPYIEIPYIVQEYGILPILLCLLGAFLLVVRGGRRNYGLILGLLALLLMLVTFFTFHYGVEIMYYRGLLYMMLLVSIVAGAGLMAVKKLMLPEKIGARLRAPLITQNVGRILCLALIGFTLVVAIPSHQHTPYYHMIDTQDYDAFIWIKDNVNKGYEKAILDPWKATAFTAITQKSIYTRIHAYPKAIDYEAAQFLQGGCNDTTFLREKGISIVYNRSGCDNPDLVEVRRFVYLLKEGSTD